MHIEAGLALAADTRRTVATIPPIRSRMARGQASHIIFYESWRI
jgi:hypothetical protein